MCNIYFIVTDFKYFDNYIHQAERGIEESCTGL